MEKLFIAPLNPIAFNGDMPDWYWFQHAKKKCYYQKFKQEDSTIIQVLSEVDFTVELRDFETNSLIATLGKTKLETSIIGQEFDVYNVNINFASIPKGYYYLEVSWEDGVTKHLYSEPIHISDHEGTLLFEYRNSENNFSVIFTPETVFKLRVEGTIQDFTPSSNDEIYNDQKRNATLLYSQPFQKFNLYVGNASGIPDWMADKVNRVMSCDEVKIDGYFFNKEEGASWEINRQEEYPFSGMQLEITPTFNLFNEEFQEEDIDQTNESVLLRKNARYLNKSGSFSVENIFKKDSVLDYIAIYRTSTTPFVLRVGLTVGGNEIGEFDITETSQTLTIRHLFDGDWNLHISGIAGNADINFVYEQLDKLGGGGGDNVPVPPPSLPVGTVLIYGRSAMHFNNDFSRSTGLANEASPWYGWALCDGRNGTVNMVNRFPIGVSWDGFYTIGQTGGEREVTLTVGQMPSHDHELSQSIHVHHRSFKGDSGSDHPLKNTGDFYMNKTKATGGNQPHNNMPPFIGAPFVQKIF